jgi:prephenate dehydratase
MTNKIAYLGPRGSFAEAALKASGALDSGAEAMPCANVLAALDSVRAGDVDAALVPIENSVEGSVSVTLDELSNGKRLVIVDEVVLPVEFSLLVRPGTELASIKNITTHPHAQAQVRRWIEKNVPEAAYIPSMSTASAAESLITEPTLFDAAVAQEIAAEIYGLEVLASGIGDNPDASTRFVLVQLPGAIPAPTGADKTTLSLFMRENHPGALMEILTEFVVRGIDLTRLESRPTKKSLGDYYFSVDLEGHVDDLRVSEALMGLHRVCADVRFLGSYPRHDGREAHVREGVTDQDFDSALIWLKKLKGKS